MSIKQKALSMTLASAVLFGTVSTASALDGYNDVSETGTGQSAVTLEVVEEVSILSATVPAELPLKMDLNGNVVVPTTAVIQNGVADKAIAVTKVHVDTGEGWTPAAYSDDFTAKTNDSQELALKFRSDEMNADGSFDITESDWIIQADGSLDLNMGAKIPKQTTTGSRGKIATVSYTLDWAPETEEDPFVSGIDWNSGLMIPGSKNTATFAWTGDEDRQIVSITSDNEEVAEISSVSSVQTSTFVIPSATEGEEDTSVEKYSVDVDIVAKQRGEATITGTFSDESTESFVVQVFDLSEATLDEGSSEETGMSYTMTGTAEVSSEIKAGDVLAADNLTVSIPVVLPDGTTTDMEVEVENLPTTELAGGENTFTVTTDAGGVTININIVVTVAADSEDADDTEEQEKTVESIAISTAPTKTEYTEGDSFDSTGMAITVSYSDGSSETKTEGFTVTDGSNLSVGKESVTISYTENEVTKTCIQAITVNSSSTTED